jgi:predicted  nucleic acid-binding Zn-ribbon protein
MTRQEAIKKLRRLLGDKLGYRVDPDAPSKEEREAARAALHAARAEHERIDKELFARKQAICAADSEFQRLRVALKEARERQSKLASLAHRKKFTVGTSSEMFFHVKADGDSWEECIAKLTAEKKRDPS